MKTGAMLVLGSLVALAGCDDSSSGGGGVGGSAGAGGSAGTGGGGGSGGASACATDIQEGEVQEFGDAIALGSSEGITFDGDGTLYVSAQDRSGGGGGHADDQLVDVAADGSNTIVAEAESMLGLASDMRGIVAAGFENGSLLLVDPTDGSNQVIASGPPLDAPNFVVITPWDTILVSDDSFGTDAIYEVTWEGNVSTWVEGVPTPNGMVFSLDGSFLYVATTFEEEGLWRVPVSEQGEAEMPEKWVTFPDLSTPDGVAIDIEGNVYVALNIIGEIAKVDPQGNASTLATGVPTPASLAFGRGDFDPCSLYVTNLFGEQLYRVGAGVPGAEQ